MFVFTFYFVDKSGDVSARPSSDAPGGSVSNGNSEPSPASNSGNESSQGDHTAFVIFTWVQSLFYTC